jgi:hypothetical protein
MNYKMLVAKMVMIVLAAFCWGWALGGVSDQHMLQFTIGATLAVCLTLLALLWRERRMIPSATYIEYIDKQGHKVVYPTERLTGPQIEKLKRERGGTIITENELKERHKQRTSEIRKLESWLGLK